MAHQFKRISCLFAVAVSVLACGAAALPGDPPAPAQVNDPSGDKATGSARTIEEVRGLVAELEAHVERQRSQLETTEASLKRVSPCQRAGRESDAQPANLFPEQPESFVGRRAQPSRPGCRQDNGVEVVRGSGHGILQCANTPRRNQAQISTTPGKAWESTIALIRDGHTVFSWQGHENSVFVISHDVLFRAQFEPGRTGCQVIADISKAASDSGRVTSGALR